MVAFKTSISRSIPLLLAAAGAAALAACATATPYQPNARGYGYSEQRIEQNRFRVTFSGNSDTPKQTVENYLLYRAAELTLQSGFDYFVFASDSTDANTRYLQNFGGYYGFGSYYWYPRGMYGSVGTSTATPITEYEAQASVVMFAGKKKDDDVKAFDAHQVRANLEASILRPVPKG
ncbi:MAG: CC0125/CC1285 family lipoprotein [Solimonas sp.]